MHSSTDAFTQTSIKLGISFLAKALVSLYGEINGIIVVTPFFERIRATKITRLLCSFLSSGEKPRSLLKVLRISSPSRISTGIPLL